MSGYKNSITDINGNVGIGTSSPATELDIAKDINAKLRITSTRNGSFVEGDNFGSLEFYGKDTSGLGEGIRAAIRAKAQGIYGVDTILTFSTSNSSTGLDQERIRINTGGDISFRDSLANQAFYWDASTARLGLGTTSPATDLHIQSASPTITLEDTGATATATIRSNDYGTLIYEADPTNAEPLSDHIFKTDGSERMRIDSNGRVGIGTDSPSNQLEVRSAAANSIQVAYTGVSTLSLKTVDSSLTSIEFVGASGNAGLSFVDASSNGAERMRITSSGDVILNGGSVVLDNSAYYYSKLSGGATVRMLGINSANIAYVGAIDSGATSTIFNASSTSAHASFYTSGSEKMRIDSSGKVGIGTSSPSRDFHIIKSAPGGQVRAEINNTSNTVNSHGVVSIYSGGISSGDPFLHWQIANSTAWSMGIDNSDSDKLKISQAFGHGLDDRLTINTSGNVGIGVSPTTSQTRALHIGSDTGSAEVHITSTTGSGLADGLSLIQTGVTSYLFNRENGNVIFGSNNTERMRITSTGNVGIGTSSPSAALHISGGDILANQVVAKISLGPASSTGDAHFGASGIGSPTVGSQDYGFYSAHNAYRTSNGAWKHSRAGTISAVRLLGSGGASSGNQGFSFDYSPNVGTADITWSNLMQILPSGNVGIGTKSPVAKLAIKDGNVYIDRDTTSGTYAFGFYRSGAERGRLGFDYSSSTLNLQADGVMTFLTLGENERMRIDASGNVGIGTSAPSAKLHVNGGTAGNTAKVIIGGNDATIRLGDNQAGGPHGIQFDGAFGYDGMSMYYRTTPQQIFFEDSTDFGGGTVMVIGRDGRVGIGTSSPSQLLTLVASNNFPFIHWNNTSGTNMAFAGYHISGGDFRIGTAPSLPLVFQTNTTERMRILSNGNVGIGTTSPVAKLHTIGEIVGGTTGFTSGMNGFTGLGSYDSSAAVENIDSLYLRKGGTNGSSTSIAFASASGDTYFVGSRIKHIRSGSNSKGHLAFETKGDTSINTTSERMRITDAGNVGIGTTSPSNTTHIYKNATIGPINSTTTANAGLRIQDNASSMYFDGNSIVLDSTGYLTTTGNSDFFIGTNNVTRLFVKGDGNVGIGTSSPAAFSGRVLHIHDSSISRLKLTNDTTGTTAYDGFDTLISGSDASFVNRENGNMSFSTNAVERMRIDSNGKVGIGTSTLNWSLNVGNGTTTMFLNPTPTESSFGNNTAHPLAFYTNSTRRMLLEVDGDLHVDGDVIAYSTTISDERLKDNIVTIDNALDKVCELRGVEYDWNASSRSGQHDMGVIAQEVEKVFPFIVREKEMPLVDGNTYKTVDYEKIVGVLIEAVKELKQEIEILKAK